MIACPRCKALGLRRTVEYLEGGHKLDVVKCMLCAFRKDRPAVPDNGGEDVMKKENPVKKCAACGRPGIIKARKQCSACYQRELKAEKGLPVAPAPVKRGKPALAEQDFTQDEIREEPTTIEVKAKPVKFNDSGSKYLRKVTLTEDGRIDVYAVLLAFDVTCPARQHAIKKLLCSGLRGKGDVLQDLREAQDAITRSAQLWERGATS